MHSGFFVNFFICSCFLSFKSLKNLIAVEEGSVSVILILRVMIFYNAKLHKFLRYCKSFNQIKSLDITDARVSKLSREKARNWDRDRHASWLRIYAIRLEPNIYVVTRGAIKLTHTMQERKHTTLELQKLNRCRDYLRSNGVFDQDSFVELANE